MDLIEQAEAQLVKEIEEDSKLDLPDGFKPDENVVEELPPHYSEELLDTIQDYFKARSGPMGSISGDLPDDERVSEGIAASITQNH